MYNSMSKLENTTYNTVLCSVLEGNLDDTCNQQRMYQSTGDNQELPQELTYNVQAAKQYKMTIVL